MVLVEVFELLLTYLFSMLRPADFICWATKPSMKSTLRSTPLMIIDFAVSGLAFLSGLTPWRKELSGQLP